MQNLLSLPSPLEDSSTVNLADWVEMTAWLAADRNASREDLQRALKRDGSLTTRIGPAADMVFEDKATEVFAELLDRHRSCGTMNDGSTVYPFDISDDRSLLTARSKKVSESNLPYLFLLTVTRADMSSTSRKLMPLDPTKIFERLCRDVLEIFWGGASKKSGALQFGTANRSAGRGRQFPTKIDELCKILAQGGGWKASATSPGSGDGGLDLVAWRRFSDGRSGGLLGFGQCKTGIHWDRHLTELNPRNFNRTYMVEPLILDPLKLYMIPARISIEKWDEHSGDGGLLFDRCRLVEHAHRLSMGVAKDCRNWLSFVVTEQQSRMKRAREI